MTKRPKAKPKSKRHSSAQVGGLVGLSALVLAALLYSVYGLRPQDTLSVGEASPRTFSAPVTTEVVDPLLTEAERQAARSQVGDIYIADSNLQRLVINAVTAAGLPARVEEYLLDVYRVPRGISEAGLKDIVAEAVALSPEERRREVRLLLERRLVPTSVVSNDLTEAARNAAAEAVRPVPQVLTAGQIIVRQGDILNDDHLRALEALGLYSAQADIANRQLRTVISCLALGLLLSLPLLYAARRLRALSLRQVGFLVALSLLTVGAQYFAFTLHEALFIALLLPVLVTVLVSDAAGILWAVWLAVALALLDPTTPLFTFFLVLAGGLVTNVFAKSFRTRTSLLLAGLLGGVAAALGYALLLLLYGTTLSVNTAYDLLTMVGSGSLGGLLALGLLPLAESVFDFLTEFRLAELSNPSTPLLQKLLLEAPGTYQHSLIISNLVEQAVSNIGGNALLARVGALYHDVGKLKRPHFFVENQFSGENPHDSVSPHLSFLIITSHTRDGVDMIRDYKLPKALERFAAEHHGTTVLSYFYKRALEDSSKIDELNFRYPGPKPQSKESAVLMLADAVESASRSLSEPSQGSIRAMIDRLIDARLQDNQLAESPLTIRDVEIVANTFERMLTAILHRRISYPSSEEIQGLKRAGDTQRNPAVSPS